MHRIALYVIVTCMESRARNNMVVLGKGILPCTFFEIPIWKGVFLNPRMCYTYFVVPVRCFCLVCVKHLNLLRKGLRSYYGCTVYDACFSHLTYLRNLSYTTVQKHYYVSYKSRRFSIHDIPKITSRVARVKPLRVRCILFGSYVIVVASGNNVMPTIRIMVHVLILSQRGLSEFVLLSIPLRRKGAHARVCTMYCIYHAILPVLRLV